MRTQYLPSLLPNFITKKQNISESYLHIIYLPFVCNLGVRQGECLSPFLFAMYINDLEDEIIQKGVGGVDIGMLKLFILLYADDIVLLAEN